VFALDPKGDHLLANAASRKLLDIRDEKGQRKLIVRFVSEGRWIADPVKWQASGGYTVWMIRSGVLHAKHYGSLDRAIKGALTA
jgi:type III restriction enzyme